MVVGAALCTGCGGGANGKSPAQGATITLRAISDAKNDPVLAALASRVERLTSGRVRIEVVQLEPDARRADEEVRRFERIVNGTYDLGLLPTRAIEAGGERSMAAFDAPLVVPSLASEKRILASNAPRLAFRALTSVRGLAVLPGTLIRPFGTPEPLLGPEDYRGGLRFFPGSPTYAATATALGGTPVVLGSAEWLRRMAAHELRGTAVDVRVVRGLGLARLGTLTTNVVLFARFRVVVAGRAALDDLTADDRDAVVAAARHAATDELASLPDEAAVLRELCVTDAHVAAASAAAIGRLVTVVAPLNAAIASDPVAGPVFASLKAAVGSESMSTAIEPARCAAVRRARTAGAPATSTGTLPDGTYRQRIDLAEITRVHPTASSADLRCGTGVYTLRLSAGRFEFQGRSIGLWEACGNDPNDPPLPGRYTTRGDHVTFTLDQLTTSGEHEQGTYRWAVTKSGLDFTWVGGNEGAGTNGIAGLTSTGGFVNHWIKVR